MARTTQISNLLGNRERATELLQLMMRIRLFELKVAELYRDAKIHGLAHVYLGQEAVAVGVCSQLNRDDYITSTHRGHGHCIAKGGDTKRMMAEILGRWDGYCHGKGGSMHIAELDLGILGANGIVGGGIPLAVGAALTAKCRKSGQVVACFFGEGATATGSFHEGINLAAVWKLPVLFICENNMFSEFSPWRSTSPVDSVATRAAAYGISGMQVDGNDLTDVIRVAREAIDRARAGQGPTLIEARTYRWEGHYVGDPQKYRTKEEVATWKEKDPIRRLVSDLGELNLLGAEEVEQVEDKLRTEIRDAVSFGMNSPEPSLDTLKEGVYAPSVEVPESHVASGPTHELSYREALNEALFEEMDRDERVVVLGEDVATHGGPFQVTRNLVGRFGPNRVLDTPIAEDAIAGCCVGAALTGLRPVCEIMYMNFMTISMNAIVNQAAKIRYMFGGKASLPMVVRTQSGISTGSAGQHSDNWEAWFHHVPGLKVAVASTPEDAKGLLKAAIRDDNPVIFIERKRLYNLKGQVPKGEYIIPLGKARICLEGSDVTLISWGAILQEVLKTADRLAGEGVSVEVIDPRTLYPLDQETLIASAQKTRRVVVVHEAPLRGGLGAELAAMITEQCFDVLKGPVIRLGAKEVPIPFAENLERAVLPQGDEIYAACRKHL